ncbi:MAG: B12-binding domain-containing radical SAM protein [Actinobacteria bacterium]|nr:B12-binding domain-containing radical SAM protein [Actinomycetota bacterium]
MRVLLIQPRQRRRAGFRSGFRTMAVVEPLGLEMVAAALKVRHEVRLADLLPGVDLESIVRRFSPDICGISCSFTVDVKETYRVAQTVKKLRPASFVFVGGHHASLNPTDFAVPWVDAVVNGEGEVSASELVCAVESGRDLRSVPGLVLNFRDYQSSTGIRSLVSMDELPFPARSLVHGLRKSYHLGLRGPLASLETSRGCPYRCTFCSVWRFHQGKVRFKSPDRVLDEIETIEGRNVFITDDNFLASISRAERIADLLMQRRVKKRFIFQARTDSIARHSETVAKLREAGFATVFLGLEKIDAEGLESVRKSNTVESNEKALEVLKKVGVNVFGTLIVDPDYDEADFRRLRDYVSRHAIANAWFTVLTPLPGTALFEQLQEALTTRNWEMFDLIHAVLPTRLDLERFYREYARLYMAVYSPWALAERGWNALFNRHGRSLGNFPSPALIWHSFESLRCMSDPREYLLAHADEPHAYGG